MGTGMELLVQKTVPQPKRKASKPPDFLRNFDLYPKPSETTLEELRKDIKEKEELFKSQQQRIEQIRSNTQNVRTQQPSRGISSSGLIIKPETINEYYLRVHKARSEERLRKHTLDEIIHIRATAFVVAPQIFRRYELLDEKTGTIKGTNIRPETLALAIAWKESGINSRYYDNDGYYGLLNISMKEIGKPSNMTENDLYDPLKNLHRGLSYIAAMINKAKIEERKTGVEAVRTGLAGYNGGWSNRKIRRTISYANDVLTKEAEFRNTEKIKSTQYAT